MAKPGLLMRIYQYYNKIIEVASVVVLVFVTIVVFVSVDRKSVV